MLPHADIIYSWFNVIKITLYLCGLPLQTHNLILILKKKKIRLIQIDRHLTKYLASIPENQQGHQKQEKAEDCYGQQEPNRT